MDFDNPKVYRDTSITDGLVLLFQGLGSSKYLSREDIMLDEEGHLLAVGGQHQNKVSHTYGRIHNRRPLVALSHFDSAN